MNDSRPPKHGRRWHQFSLRTLLVLTAVFALLLGWVTSRVRRARLQKEVIIGLRDFVGGATFDWGGESFNYDPTRSWQIWDDPDNHGPQPSGPRWLRRLIGSEYFQEITKVTLLDPSVPDSEDRAAQFAHLLERLGRCTSLESLTVMQPPQVNGTPPTMCDDHLKHLQGLVKLKKLSLAEMDISGEGLVHLKDMQQLEHLNLSGTGITDAGMIHLGRLRRLKLLDLQRTEVTGRRMRHLSGLAELKELDLSDTRFTGDVFGYTHKCRPPDLPSLVKLNLANAAVNDEVLSLLQNCAALKWLNLAGNELGGYGLVHLKNLRKLEWLDLSGNILDGSDILYGMRKYQEAPDCLAPLRVLTRLRHLDLGRQFPDQPYRDNLEHLAPLTGLESLRLEHWNIRDSQLAYLADLRQLKQLDLSNTKITDAGLMHLKHLTKLKFLDLSENQLTDQGLVHLLGLTNLEDLRLRETKVTETGADELRTVNPKLDVFGALLVPEPSAPQDAAGQNGQPPESDPISDPFAE